MISANAGVSQKKGRNNLQTSTKHLIFYSPFDCTLNRSLISKITSKLYPFQGHFKILSKAQNHLYSRKYRIKPECK